MEARTKKVEELGSQRKDCIYSGATGSIRRNKIMIQAAQLSFWEELTNFGRRR
jgi:hypothetical protein